MYLVQNVWVVPVKCHPNECQDTGFPSRAMHYNEMINLFSPPVSGFNVVADQCIQLRPLSKVPCSMRNLNHVLITIKIHVGRQETETRCRLLERPHTVVHHFCKKSVRPGDHVVLLILHSSLLLSLTLFRATICNELSSGV